MGRTAAITRLLRRARGDLSEAAGAAAGEDSAAGPESADGDEVDLEAGIAEIFESIRSGDAGSAAGELPEDTGATYDLLMRLNQLWQSPGQGAA